jgi:uncharacterized protein YbjT (DUF2867 family)
MKVLVIGSTGGSGRAAIESLVAAGHEVTAFSRRGGESRERLRQVTGDAMSASDISRAVRGHDAVVVTLGISENPFRVRLFGPARTPIDIRSRGTRNVIAAMREHGVRRLVVQTTYGVGDSRARLRFIDRLFFALLLKPQIADTEIQQRDVMDSGLDWVVVQPVHLTDADTDAAVVSITGEPGGAAMSVSRKGVGRVLASAVDDPAVRHATLALFG